MNEVSMTILEGGLLKTYTTIFLSICNLGVELLCHGVGIFLLILETASQFGKQDVLSDTPISNEWEF